MIWSWIPQNLGLIEQLTLQNAYLGIVSALFGLVISVPLGVACARWSVLYPPVLSVTSALYAVPSLALFVVLIAYTGLSDLTVIIALTLFSLCVLVPNVVDGLRSVPEPVRQAATAMGFGTLRRLWQVELPVAIPVIIAGMRVATVSSISLASLGQLIGVSCLGYLFIDGLQRDFPTEIFLGIGLVVILALVADGALLAIRRLLTPWQRRARATAAPPSVLTPRQPAGQRSAQASAGAAS
ncbi:MAG TPA: ABC transporter permease [Streptosporangiaceae bacterium]|nr:ABC transporter permease [Streptosporangiaceae bacterium]